MAALAAVVVVAVVAGLVGQAAAWSVRREPSGVVAKCRLGPDLAPKVYQAPPARCIDTSRPWSAVIHTTKGEVTVAFLVGSAPDTVNNFIALAANGYYDGTPFFKSTDWYVQGGDPQGDGRGGPGYTLDPEVLPNDPWQPGSLGMARTADGINGSQFFITKASWPGGNPTTAYNHFATVTLGFDKVGQLTAGDRITGIDIKRG